jgi:hypothetical protein
MTSAALRAEDAARVSTSFPPSVRTAAHRRAGSSEFAQVRGGGGVGPDSGAVAPCAETTH